MVCRQQRTRTGCTGRIFFAHECRCSWFQLLLAKGESGETRGESGCQHDRATGSFVMRCLLRPVSQTRRVVTLGIGTHTIAPHAHTRATV